MSSSPPDPPAVPVEQLIWSKGNVRITTGRLVVGDTLFPLSGIHLVQVARLAGRGWLARVAMIVLIFIWLGVWSNDEVPSPGLVWATIGVGLWWLLGARRAAYALRLGLLTGPRDVLWSREQADIEEVRGALTEALSRRGR